MQRREQDVAWLQPKARLPITRVTASRSAARDPQPPRLTPFQVAPP